MIPAPLGTQEAPQSTLDLLPLCLHVTSGGLATSRRTRVACPLVSELVTVSIVVLRGQKKY